MNMNEISTKSCAVCQHKTRKNNDKCPETRDNENVNKYNFFSEDVYVCDTFVASSHTDMGSNMDTLS